jgi:AcrR family transcriptional regulator
VNQAAASAAAARDRILASAYELFAHNGIRAVGIDEVIRHADVAKATLYRHFSSKDCGEHLANIRSFTRELATEAGLRDPEQLAHSWHLLMKGSIVAAGEGDADAESAPRRWAVC